MFLNKFGQNRYIFTNALCNYLNTHVLKSQEYFKNVDASKEFDVVVIGGGVFGCSLLYHLVKEGIKNIALFEKDSITCGTTWHTAGLLWRLRPNDIEIQLLNYTRWLMKSLETETGISTGWFENGGLFLASTPERLKEYQRLSTLGKFFDVESRMLRPSDIGDVHPLIDANHVTGALYSPGDGQIDPTGYCNALIHQAKKSGAKVFENCIVDSIQMLAPIDGASIRPKVAGIHFSFRPTAGATMTDDSSIKTGMVRCRQVVNCAGVWACSLASEIGVALPQTPLFHSYVLSESVFDPLGIPLPKFSSSVKFDHAKNAITVPNIRDHDRSIYVKLQGRQSFAFGGYETNPAFVHGPDNKTPKLSSAPFNLFDLNWDVFDQNLKGCLEIMPILREAGIKSTVCGYESFTPDHKPIIGESLEVSGYYHGSGFNSSGMMLSGGCGREVAKLIARGRPDLDLFNFDIRRFNKRYTSNTAWIIERSHEAYAKNYSIVFPNDEPLASRNLRKSPLYQTLLDRGCVYQERHGWERPGWFDPTHTARPVLPYDYYGAYDSLGTVRTPNFYAEALKNDYTFGARYYVAVGGAVAQYFRSHLTRVIEDLADRKVTIVDKTDEMGLISLQGPRSRDILQPLVNVDLKNETFPFSSHKIALISNRYPVRLVRISFVGELGWEIHLANESSVAVYDLLIDAGQRYDLKNAGYRAIDFLSLEKGYYHWHAEIRTDDTPYEAGLSFTCNKMKEESSFLGKEALLSSKKRSELTKKIAFFTIDEKVPLFGLETIWRNGQECVGFLRRAGYAFSLEKSVGFGYVHSPSLKFIEGVASKEATSDIPTTFIDNHYLTSADFYEIESFGRRYKANIHLKSPFDPSGLRIKGIY
ncbi:sarcosine dehydrogenase, mitochondrial-like isoform X2 [Gordionus sp. m RMFG-2023]|uniref:sarcosine dehydrogenase, mitochondrial-like isoform X2 n=1 Tax=Gordionus sp. m RMFG-2023 TaxID=3053472 RepID=UPI0031FD3019